MEFVAAARLRGWAMDWLDTEVFAHCDALVTPTLAAVPPVLTADAKINGESNVVSNVQLLRFIFMGNFVGNPGLTVPVGRDEKTKLPTGLHLLGAHWKEAILFRLANALEKTHPNKRHHPAAYVD